MLQVIPNVHLFLLLNFKLSEQDSRSRDHEFSETFRTFRTFRKLPACGGDESVEGLPPGGGRARPRWSEQPALAAEGAGQRHLLLPAAADLPVPEPVDVDSAVHEN